MSEPTDLRRFAGDRTLRRWHATEDEVAAWARQEHGLAGELAVRAVYAARLNGYLGQLPRISDAAFDRYMAQVRAGKVEEVLADLERCDLLPDVPEPLGGGAAALPYSLRVVRRTTHPR